MNREDEDTLEAERRPNVTEVTSREAIETDEEEHPAPGIAHHQEPDAENIMPVKDAPGTL